jgi:hypothetical protein
MESDATAPLLKLDTCIFPCSRILNPKEPLLAAMEPIEVGTESRSVLSSSLTKTESLRGAISRRSP